MENPLLAGKQLLVLKRFAYDSDHYYDEFIAGIRRFGGGLCTVSLPDAKVTDIAAELGTGLFDRYDLSFDARRIVFDYKPCQPGGFRLFEIGVDGTNLRQLTFPPEDEPQRMAKYSAVSSGDALRTDPCRYGHWTDDMHPCYLPDGRIVFTSTRSERGVLCGGHSLTVTNLYRINSDGTGLHQLSQGALSEFCPSLMNDGRILYNRWEYVDKGAGAVQSLWAMYPDGGRSEEIYGNNITTPGVFTQARHVPGRDNLVACLGASHCPGNMGAILLVDLSRNKRSTDAMTALTPTCIPKGNWGLRQLAMAAGSRISTGPGTAIRSLCRTRTTRPWRASFSWSRATPMVSGMTPPGMASTCWMSLATAYRCTAIRGSHVSGPAAGAAKRAPGPFRAVAAGLRRADGSGDVADDRRVPGPGRSGSGRGEVPADHGAGGTALVRTAGIPVCRRRSRPDGGHQPVHASERQGPARSGARARGRIGLFPGTGRPKRLPAGIGQGLHGDPTHADVREFSTG